MTDLDWIKVHYSQLVEKYAQKWIIVMDQEIYGVYDTHPIYIPVGATLLFVKDKK